jgi:DNA-binding transcriptional regulator YhcF (GntR family)
MYHLAMTKKASSFDLVVRERQPGTVLFQWVYDEVRSAILDGRLGRGMRLPSTRELARIYGVSRGTVVTAFEQLHAEGYLEGSVGAGTYVNTLLPEDFLQAKRDAGPVDEEKQFGPSLSQYARRLGKAQEASPLEHSVRLKQLWMSFQSPCGHRLLRGVCAVLHELFWRTWIQGDTGRCGKPFPTILEPRVACDAQPTRSSLSRASSRGWI